MTAPYPAFLDPLGALEIEVRWTYWPVAYIAGDPTVISNVPLPLSGVQLSEIMRGVGELRATIQLADEEVRTIYPWDKIIPRKTGIVAVREVFDPVGVVWVSSAVQHYLVWAAPRDPQTGRMSIQALTVESLWARRLITKAITWANVDQAAMVADLLNPASFSQVALGGGDYTGWINVDAPSNTTGVLRSFSYDDNQETNLLEAHLARSKVDNGYEWRTSVRVQSGADAVSASSFRCQYVLGYPRLGRQLGDLAALPRLRYDRAGGGNVLDFAYAYDGTEVANIVWGRGNGYEDLQVRALVTNPEWLFGFVQTEARFSDPDVRVQATLTDYCNQYMWGKLGSEQFLSALTIRGDRPPYFGSYTIGDDVIIDTNDPTWPTDLYGADGFLSLTSRIFGWVITPPQGNNSEKIKLVVTGGDIG